MIMAPLKTYRRPMTGWWLKNPFFVWYMIRELSAVLLSIYAAILLVGVFRLSQGEAAFDAWRAALATPGSIVFHAIAVLFVVYHTWTWFKVMPKTAPMLRVAGRRVPDGLITVAGLMAAVVLSAALFCWVGWATR